MQQQCIYDHYIFLFAFVLLRFIYCNDHVNCLTCKFVLTCLFRRWKSTKTHKTAEQAKRSRNQRREDQLPCSRCISVPLDWLWRRTRIETDVVQLVRQIESRRKPTGWQSVFVDSSRTVSTSDTCSQEFASIVASCGRTSQTKSIPQPGSWDLSASESGV